MHLELLTNDQMAKADRLAMEAGTTGARLMENAGSAVAACAKSMVTPAAKVAVLCGPGNNGGDGIVAARLLAQEGLDVRLGLAVPKSALKGDAAETAAHWTGDVVPLEPGLIDGADLIIDAIFGAGLSRAIENGTTIASIIDAANVSSAMVLAVDVPSGLNGSSGLAGPVVIQADTTITFFRKKPAHLLFPGRNLCGQVVLADIGIPDTVLHEIFNDETGITPTHINAPQRWFHKLQTKGANQHKYDRGHAVTLSGPAHATGAARLAARAALRIGAGLVTVASPHDAVATNAAHLTSIMIAPFDGPGGIAQILSDPRKNACILGPGCGVGPATCTWVEAALSSGAATILDADALTSFQGAARRLKDAIARNNERPVAITPHDGEFARLCPEIAKRSELSKLEKARSAASFLGAVVILKGPDTVVAAPDGRAAINDNAPPWLATAGSGDVLSGMIGGLLAQKVPVFDAACAAVWLHGECGNALGRGLIAEDLPEILPTVLQSLYANKHQET